MLAHMEQPFFAINEVNDYLNEQKKPLQEVFLWMNGVHQNEMGGEEGTVPSSQPPVK